MEETFVTNSAHFCGKIIKKWKYSHSFLGREYYTSVLEVTRTSRKADYLPLVIVKDKLGNDEAYQNQLVEVFGQIRSYHISAEGRHRLRIVINVKKIVSNRPDLCDTLNEVYLNGFLCKPPVTRMTPKGRQITDTMLAVNQVHRSSDYIPCIFWEEYAEFVSKFQVGTNVCLLGRLESRNYDKVMGDSQIRRMVYEISVGKLFT